MFLNMKQCVEKFVSIDEPLIFKKNYNLKFGFFFAKYTVIHAGVLVFLGCPKLYGVYMCSDHQSWLMKAN